MSKTTLTHYTINTGDVVEQEPPSDPHVIESLSPLLWQCFGGSLVVIPGTDDEYWFSGRRLGDFALFSVVSPFEGAVLDFGVAPDGPSITIGIGQLSLYQDVDLSSLKNPPWCAVRLKKRIVDHIDVLSWVGEFETSVAWTYLNEVRAHAEHR